MIRSRLSSVEGLHDFMRLTGVVKECVTCAPPVDGCGMQLQDLEDDCWRLVRRYLSFDDVKCSTIATPRPAEHQNQKAESQLTRANLHRNTMENLSAAREHPSLAAFTGRVDIATVFVGRGAECLRLPCTAGVTTATQNDQVCPLNDCLPICNELLFDIGIELREQRGGSLTLATYPPFEADMMPVPGEHADRANAFLRWLLRTHVCITGLELMYELVKMHSQLVLEEVPEDSRLRKLKVHFPLERTVQTPFATLFPRLKYLEELECFMSPSTDAVVAAISALLRTTTCLTSLVFQACFDHGQPPRTFVDALAANSTLKSLELWANWSTTEPPGTLGEYVRSNRLITNLNLFGEETDREALSLDEALVRNSTLSTLIIGRLCGGEVTARFLTRILAECASIKKLTLGGLRDEYVDISEATLTRCGEALAQNETLEELTLSLKVAALQRLPSLHHFTSLSLDLFESDEPLFSTFAQYIRATTALRELRLLAANAADAAPPSCWTLLFESILANTSIAHLMISTSENLRNIDRLARTVGLSRYISRVTYVQCRGDWDPTGFVLHLSEVVGDNYNLLQVFLKGAKLGTDATRPFFTIWDTTRRNCGIVERASAFNQNTPLDW
ncbi:hypothetical protein HPB52_016341 [Rhipicephalus sanguineus]|uniref:Uncharacterized protein n=1 Tax=Rhipicephalus sanguineus TaxID=34632 RepID=A0A9D4SR53_RHISA|nr:hypothetical protein HPB52_016341 [Rhipicephalus sanguineus]